MLHSAHVTHNTKQFTLNTTQCTLHTAHCTLQVLVKLAVRDIRLDYRTRDTAELHFTVGLQVGFIDYSLGPAS